tara:strand:+ start:77162 stop:78124 length:963 start_codon:yes stop_codon:yes gene_type:complete
MSKLTTVGDPHVKNKNLEQTDELFNFIETQGNDVLITGDVFDTKEVIRGKCLNFVYNRILNSKLHYTILVGNHDYFNLECEDHALQVFKDLPNVTIVDEVIEMSPNIYAIPYVHDLDKLKAMLAEIPEGAVLFGHLDVVTFDYGNGYLSEAGLLLEDLKKFKKVISGHYHKYQEKGNLTYIGTPFSHSFGESNQEKYIGVFDSQTNNLELIKTPFPQHLTIDVNCDDYVNNNVRVDVAPSINHTRIILNGTSENIMKYRANIPLPDNSKIIERPTDEFMNGVSIDETADNLVKFKEWATEIKGLDPDTLHLGVQILEALK